MNKYLINSLNDIAKKLDESSGESKYPIDALNKIAKALDSTNKDFKYPADAIAEIANDLVNGVSGGNGDESVKEAVLGFMDIMYSQAGQTVPEEIRQLSALELLQLVNYQGQQPPTGEGDLGEELLNFLSNIAGMGGSATQQECPSINDMLKFQQARILNNSNAKVAIGGKRIVAGSQTGTYYIVNSESETNVNDQENINLLGNSRVNDILYFKVAAGTQDSFQFTVSNGTLTKLWTETPGSSCYLYYKLLGDLESESKPVITITRT